MLTFKISKGIAHIVAHKTPMKATLMTWPKVYLLIFQSTSERPAIFYPEGYSFTSAPLPPQDENEKYLWEKMERINYHEKTKDYFGAKYGTSFDVPIVWLENAVRENRNLNIKLNAGGDLIEAHLDKQD
jgi:hypothetical protein